MTEVDKSEVMLSGPNGEPLVQKTPGVCGGKACVGNTRIGVWLLIAHLQDGASEVDLLNAFPILLPEHIAAAREYYRLHPAEIDEAIRKNELMEE